MMATIRQPVQGQSWFDMAIEEEIDRAENTPPCGKSLDDSPPLTSTPIRKDAPRARSSRRIPARRRLVEGYDRSCRQDYGGQRHDRRSRSMGSERKCVDFDRAILDKERSPLRADLQPRFSSMSEATESWAQVVSKMSSRTNRPPLSENTLPAQNERTEAADGVSPDCSPREQPLAESCRFSPRDASPEDHKRSRPVSESPTVSEKEASQDATQRKRRYDTNFSDPHRLAQRQKQIDYGKNTIGYDRYIKAIPRHQRKPGMPRTPNKHLNCPKRTFDIMLRHWRRSLHEWDPEEQGEEPTLVDVDLNKSSDSAVFLGDDNDTDNSMSVDATPSRARRSAPGEDSFFSEFDLSACSMDIDFLVSPTA